MKRSREHGGRRLGSCTGHGVTGGGTDGGPDGGPDGDNMRCRCDHHYENIIILEMLNHAEQRGVFIG